MTDDPDGPAADFDAFYAASSRRVLHAVYAMTGDAGEAQDCVQEAFARAWQRWRVVSGYGDPEAWVRTVARRIAVSRWRKARNAMTSLARHSADRQVTGAPSEDHVVLVTALRKLSTTQRHALVLHYLVGLSVEEIAREVGAPAGTVKARLHRGRTALAGHLGSLDAPPDTLLPGPSSTPSTSREVRRAR